MRRTLETIAGLFLVVLFFGAVYGCTQVVGLAPLPKEQSCNAEIDPACEPLP